MKKKLLLILVSILLLNSCKLYNDELELSKLLLQEVHHEKIDLIIIVTEVDCNSCIENFLKENSIGDNVIGLVYSNSSDNLKKRLDDEFNQINWVLLNNVDILTSIKRMNNDYYSGPYFFDLIDGKYIQRK